MAEPTAALGGAGLLLVRQLRRGQKLAAAIAAKEADFRLLEVMLNPDGRLWIDRLSGGLEDSGGTMSAADGERIVRLLAHRVGAEVHAERPRVSAELPETGERFEGLLPPVVAAPAFAIRKPAVAVFTLEDYVASGTMTASQATALKGAVRIGEPKWRSWQGAHDALGLRLCGAGVHSDRHAELLAGVVLAAA